MKLMVKNLPANAEDRKDMDSIPELGRSSGGGHGSPLQYFSLANPCRQRSSPWGRKESDMIEQLNTAKEFVIYSGY